MAYKGMSIRKVIRLINSDRMFLPAIQRKYVWDENRIIKLFDSIMLGYPIGTFLFWEVNKNTANNMNYSFYKFINNYHERDNFVNPLVAMPIEMEHDTFFSVLDGQQRLTSLYIALQGSLSLKKYKAWATNDDAYIKKELYFNIEKEPIYNDEEEVEEDENANSLTYEFKFLTEDEALKDKRWFKVKNILKYETLTDLVVFLKNGNYPIVAYSNLSKLFDVLTKDDNSSPINYFDIPTECNMNDVLKVFVRVNSGGIILSKTDLLFSTIVSYWDKGREKVEELIKEINNQGQKFKFSNDFIMRTCLCVLDFPISLKPETFTKANVEQIKTNWTNIAKSIKDTVKLIVDFGFCHENLVSYNAVIPIIYYLYKNGKIDDDTKEEIKKYLIIAETKQIFGVASNQAISSVRNEMNKAIQKKEKFKMEILSELSLVGDRNFLINDDYLETLFKYDKGPYTFMILTLLYPNIIVNGTYKFHQDHMHPFTGFVDSKLKAINIDENTIHRWKKDRNKLANLQLLQSDENESKNRSPLIDWLQTHQSEVKYLPENISYELKNFDEFFKERKNLLKNQLKEIFGISKN